MSDVKRPKGSFEKWSASQAAKFIRDCVKSGDAALFLIQDPHAYQRMGERGFSMDEVHEIILKGKCENDESHDMKYRDRRLTFSLEKRSTGKQRSAVVAIDDELPGCMLITVF